MINFKRRQSNLFLIAFVLIGCNACKKDVNDSVIVAEPVLALSAPLNLPLPGGTYGVGKTGIQFEDESRTELLCPDEWNNKHRRFAATVYYPVNKGTGEDALYFDGANASALSFLTGEPTSIFADYRSHSVVNGVQPAGTAFPVLLFSCGGGENPQFYSSLLEDIASNGYIVFSLSHSFDSPETILGDDSVAYCPRNYFTGAFIFKNALTTSALSGNKEVFKQLTSYEPRPSDMAFVLSHLNDLNAAHHVLQGTLDVEHVGVFGHSLGGAAAVQTGLDFPSVKLVAVLDSYIFYIVDTASKPLTQPVLMLYSDSYMEDEPDVIEAQNVETDAFLSQSASYSKSQISGIGHLAFMTDYLWIEPLFKANKSGESSVLREKSPEQAYTEISTSLVEFFNNNMKQHSAN